MTNEAMIAPIEPAVSVKACARCKEPAVFVPGKPLLFVYSRSWLKPVYRTVSQELFQRKAINYCAECSAASIDHMQAYGSHKEFYNLIVSDDRVMPYVDAFMDVLKVGATAGNSNNYTRLWIACPEMAKIQELVDEDADTLNLNPILGVEYVDRSHLFYAFFTGSKLMTELGEPLGELPYIKPGPGMSFDEAKKQALALSRELTAGIMEYRKECKWRDHVEHLEGVAVVSYYSKVVEPLVSFCRILGLDSASSMRRIFQEAFEQGYTGSVIIDDMNCAGLWNITSSTAQAIRNKYDTLVALLKPGPDGALPAVPASVSSPEPTQATPRPRTVRHAAYTRDVWATRALSALDIRPDSHEWRMHLLSRVLEAVYIAWDNDETMATLCQRLRDAGLGLGQQREYNLMQLMNAVVQNDERPELVRTARAVHTNPQLANWIDRVWSIITRDAHSPAQMLGGNFPAVQAILEQAYATYPTEVLIRTLGGHGVNLDETQRAALVVLDSTRRLEGPVVVQPVVTPQVAYERARAAWAERRSAWADEVLEVLSLSDDYDIDDEEQSEQLAAREQEVRDAVYGTYTHHEQTVPDLLRRLESMGIGVSDEQRADIEGLREGWRTGNAWLGEWDDEPVNPDAPVMVAPLQPPPPMDTGNIGETGTIA